MKRLLIIGCGNSGTRYTAAALRRTGLDFGHEEPRPDGMAAWMLTPNRGDVLHKGQPIRHEDFDLILHQVRDPLACIRTWLRLPHQWRVGDGWARIARISGLDRWDHPIRNWMRHWCLWNALAARAAARTFRVENLAEELPKICAEVEADYNPHATTGLSRRIGSTAFSMRSMMQFCWAHLERVDRPMAQACRAQAEFYGYEYP